MKSLFILMALLLVSPLSFAGGKKIGQLTCSLIVKDQLKTEKADIIAVTSSGSTFITTSLDVNLDKYMVKTLLDWSQTSISVEDNSGNILLDFVSDGAPKNNNFVFQINYDKPDQVSATCDIKMKKQVNTQKSIKE